MTPRVVALAAVLIGCGGDPPPWDKGLPATASIYPARRGLREVRGPIHLHSPYSWDACDKMPVVDGQPNATCLEDLRAGLCTTRQDFAMLTDHADLLARSDWDALFLPGPADEIVRDGDRHVASWLACPDGTRVLVTVGSENQLMPLGLAEHVAATIDERTAILTGGDAAAAAALRAHGALVAVAHGEGHPLDQLRAVEPDALEIYNLHANLGPDIRAMMGLDPTAPLVAILPFINGDDAALEPDLAALAFLEENAAERARLDALWGEGRRVVATLGADAHENVVSLPLRDGERGDGYRRVLRWFSNHLLVTELGPAGLVEAIRAGRAYGVFEVLGVPVGFDFRAEAGGVVAELGDTVVSGATLIVEPPTARDVDAADVTVRLLRIDGAGSAELARGDGRAPLRAIADRPGAYRADVRVTPRGLRRFMGSIAPALERELVWIDTSPIYVR